MPLPKSGVSGQILLKFEQAQAEEGKDLYQYRLGMRYLNGDGVEKDLTQALDLLAKSAAQGNKNAAKELAKISGQRRKAAESKGEGR